MALRSVVLAVVVAVGLTGCSAQLDAPLASAPASVDTPAPDASLRPDSKPPTPARTLSAAQTRGLESTPWQLVSQNGQALRIRYVAGGSCYRWSGVRVQETAKSVEIWTTTKPPKGDPACLLLLTVSSSTITLRNPLGSRTLLHAPVSPSWTEYVDHF